MNHLRTPVRSIVAITIALLMVLQGGVLVSADETLQVSAQYEAEVSNGQVTGNAQSVPSGGSQGLQTEKPDVGSASEAKQTGQADTDAVQEEQAEDGTAVQTATQSGNAVSEAQITTQNLGDPIESNRSIEKMPPQYFERTSGSGIKVAVMAPEGTFPTGTTMSVADVSRETAISIARAGASSPETVQDASGVDISFTNKEGQKIEPADGKSVSVKILLSRNLEGEQFSIVHEDEQNGCSKVADASETAAVFQADSFSIYVISGEEPAIVTYRFYDENGNLFSYTEGDVIFNEQKIKKGETLYSPKNPEKDGYIFQGWTTEKDDGTVDQKPFSSITPSVTTTTEINYYPVFKEAHYVFFMDGTGDDAKVYQTKAGVKNDTITVSDVKLSAAGDKTFTGWYTDDSLKTSAGDSVKLGDENIYLYPKFEEGHYLIFKTGDDATIIDPEFVAANATTTSPAKPTRAGYTFAGWSATEGATEADFTFGSAITETTTLYAVWKPAATTYTVIFWEQSSSDSKDAKDAEKTYEYLKSETRNGTTGEEVTATETDQKKSAVNDGVGFHFNKADTITLKGDGSSILNIYFDRDLFIYEFYQNYNITYDYSGYPRFSGFSNLINSISGLYGATMEQSGATWPTGYVWDCQNNFTYPYIDAFLPVKEFTYKGDSATIKFGRARGYYPLRYYREAVTGGGYTEELAPEEFTVGYDFAGWNFENVYSGFKVSKFRVKDWYSNNKYSDWVNVSPNGSVSLSKTEIEIASDASFGGLDIYYSRNQHSIKYSSGNKIIHQK
jgi:uncharacterized repeat protein (TIGR02543 family)